MVWTNLATALRQVHRFEEAITAYENAIAICAEHDDRYGQAQTLTNLGRLHTELSDPERARRAWAHAGELYTAAGADEDAARTRRRIVECPFSLQVTQRGLDTLGCVRLLGRDRDLVRSIYLTHVDLLHGGGDHVGQRTPRRMRHLPGTTDQMRQMAAACVTLPGTGHRAWPVVAADATHVSYLVI